MIELPVTDSALLLYPNGEVAASYPPAPLAQLSESSTGSHTVSEVRLDETTARQVEPITSTQANVQFHEYAVSAPAAAAEPAAAGAALPVTSSEASSSRNTLPVSNLFKSPWTLGFLGIVALAGGAFILL